MDDNQKKLLPSELLDLYWNYYQLHAEQRLKILELFITVQVVLIGGFLVAFSKYTKVALVAAIAVCIVALLCYCLDKRTTDLLHNCRVALRLLENECMEEYANEYKLFTSVKTNEGVLNYSKLIRGAYGIVLLIGIAMILIA